MPFSQHRLCTCCEHSQQQRLLRIEISLKMAIVDTDWKTFLSPDSDLPPDVSFLVTEDEKNSKTVKAHRWALAGVSPVFRAQFCGPMKDEQEVIEVKKTTAEAFQTLVDFIYRHPRQDAFLINNTDCPQKLFELLELAERYQVYDLKNVVDESLRNFVVTRENMVFAATVARNYKVQFEDTSVTLSMKCLKFLRATTKDSDDVFDLIGDTMNSFPGASLDILLELKKVKDENMQGNVNNCL